MVGKVLEFLWPYGRSDEYYNLAPMVASIVSGSTDKVIADRLGEYEPEEGPDNT